MQAGSAAPTPSGEVTISSPRGAPVDVRAVGLDSGRVRLEGSYRGAIHIEVREGAAIVVNRISPDGYLASVLASEIGPGAPAEALKAQAVAARSYALATAAERRASAGAPPWDLVASVADQAYRGAASETPRTRQASRDTSGEVLVHGGKVIKAVYHASSGGATTSAREAWLSDVPGPTAVFDGLGGSGGLSDESALRRFLLTPPTEVFGAAHPAFRWRVRYAATDLTTRLARSLPRLGVTPGDVGELRDIRIEARSADGRVRSLRCVGSKGEAVVRGDAIRWALGDGRVAGDGLRSTLFAIDKAGTAPPYLAYEIFGGGWGHGVGMSQAGAMDMAARGLGYRTILSHYYGDAELVRLGSENAR
ncbi:MAG: SpoIID/LytB domain-containing protein [Armatimonadia bacterium]|nr:SpoIID/LytB domain-containing protein [Armatimonadia bacterium]